VFTVRTRLCTRAVNTPVYRVHSRTRLCTGHGRTMYMARARLCTQSIYDPGHVPCTWAALYTGRKHGRVFTAVYGYTTVYAVVYPVHGRVCGPCIRPSTAMYRLCTRPCRGHVHGPSMTRTRPCLRPYTRSFVACTDRVHHDTMHTGHRKS